MNTIKNLAILAKVIEKDPEVGEVYKNNSYLITVSKVNLEYNLVGYTYNNATTQPVPCVATVSKFKELIYNNIFIRVS